MHHFVDRRQNPKGRSLGNRQRFLKRARQHVRNMVKDAVQSRDIKGRSVNDAIVGERITIPVKGISEPHLTHARNGGLRQRVFPGNKEFVVGDRFDRPKAGQGDGGKKASESGDGEDGFSFILTPEEYAELLFEGLELPELTKKCSSESETKQFRRAGLKTSGTPSNLNLIRTMRHSLGRRIALKRPSKSSLEALLAELKKLEALEKRSGKQDKRLKELRKQHAHWQSKRAAVSYIDPVDLRFNAFIQDYVPDSKAVVFCLMDVSGSMQEREKDLGKRFFLLLHLFLERLYKRTEIVFIRHTHHAEEVDENTFFYGRESGGTVVSSALEEMQRVIRQRYPVANWNIYGAQVSDGENFGTDSEKCQQLLEDQILPICQHYAYIEIVAENKEKLLTDINEGADLWQTYRKVKQIWPNFDMKRVADPSHIYPVFRALFSTQTAG